MALGAAALQAAKTGMTSPHPTNTATLECLVDGACRTCPEGP